MFLNKNFCYEKEKRKRGQGVWSPMTYDNLGANQQQETHFLPSLPAAMKREREGGGGTND